MKKYTRKGLIKFFEKLPPRSRPCKPLNPTSELRCPIGVFLDDDRWGICAKHDPPVALAFDVVFGIGEWDRLTAAQIVKIAKAAPHV